MPRTTPVKRLFLTFKQKKVHMAIVVSEYGKVLGLVTMDDLLAQIFGVLRDERADLQASMPGIKMPGAPRSHAEPGVHRSRPARCTKPDPDDVRSDSTRERWLQARRSGLIRCSRSIRSTRSRRPRSTSRSSARRTRSKPS